MGSRQSNWKVLEPNKRAVMINKAWLFADQFSNVFNSTVMMVFDDSLDSSKLGASAESGELGSMGSGGLGASFDSGVLGELDGSGVLGEPSSLKLAFSGAKEL